MAIFSHIWLFYIRSRGTIDSFIREKPPSDSQLKDDNFHSSRFSCSFLWASLLYASHCLSSTSEAQTEESCEKTTTSHSLPPSCLGYTFLHISVLTGKPIPNGEVTVPLINHFWAKQMENVHWCGHVNRHIPISICVYTKEKYAHCFILLNSPLNAKEFCILKSGLPQSMHSWQLFRESLALLSSAFSTIIWGWDI